MKRRRAKQVRKLYFAFGPVDEWPESERRLLARQDLPRRSPPSLSQRLNETAALVARRALERLRG